MQPLAAAASRTAAAPHPSRPAITSRRSGRVAANRANARMSVGHVLAGLEGAREGHVRRTDAGGGEPGEVVGAGGSEPGMVHPVLGDHHRCGGSQHRPQPVGGVVAHGDDRPGASGAGSHHALEEHDLAPLVPFGVVEERQIVHGDDARDREAQRQGVVRAVPEVGAATRWRAAPRRPAPIRAAPDGEPGPPRGPWPTARARSSASRRPGGRGAGGRRSRPASSRAISSVYTPAPTGRAGTAETSRSSRTVVGVYEASIAAA